jgi:hypothetical protein
MALNTSSGFSRLANTEAGIRSVLASIIVEPEPKHRPFVSKKKEAKRKLAEQQAQLALLQASTLDQITFNSSDPSPLTAAAQQRAELDDLAAQLRRDWGLDTTPAEPAPVVVKKKTPLKAKPPLETAEAAFTRPKTKHHATLIKRQIEVVLQVARADGTLIPFYHCDPGINTLEAELAAGRKAREYGLRVIETIAITRKEYAREI